MKLTKVLLLALSATVTGGCYADSLTISGFVSASGGVSEANAYAPNVPYTTQLVRSGAAPLSTFSSADYYARAAFGDLGLAFVASAMNAGNGCPEHASCSAVAYGNMITNSTDRLIVTGASALDFVKLNVFVDGGLGQTYGYLGGTSAEFITYDLSNDSTSLLLKSLSCDSLGYICGGQLTVDTTVLIPLTAIPGGGEYANISQQLRFQFQCSGVSGSPCNQYGTFANSAKVGGAAIVDANGNVISGATISSDSGFDYTAPIGTSVTPEPGTWLLLLSGLSLLFSPALRQRLAWLR